jgi:hypothetical protein
VSFYSDCQPSADPCNRGMSTGASLLCVSLRSCAQNFYYKQLIAFTNIGPWKVADKCPEVLWAVFLNDRMLCLTVGLSAI